MKTNRPLRGFFLTSVLFLVFQPVFGQQGQPGPGASGGTGQKPPAGFTVADVMMDFDAVWKTISEDFVDPQTYGVDWTALKTEYEPKVKTAKDAEAAYGLLKEMIGKLKSPNTDVIPPWQRSAGTGAETLTEPLLEYGGVGLLLQPLESGEVFVLQVFRGTPAEKAGVLIGDVITGVDGWRVSGENAMQAVTDRVRGPVGTRVTLTLRDPEGKERNMEIARAQIDLRPSVDYRVISGTIGYLRIPVLSKDLVDKASGALPRLLSATGLILDLRSVGAGNLEQVVAVAQWFLGAASMGGFVVRAGGQALPYNGEAIAAYQRPMVVLTNGNSYGVAEILAFILRQYRRAGVVGQETAGGFELSREVPLPSGGVLDFAVARFVSGQGTLLPLTGLQPDIEVEPPDLSLLRAGRDVVIEKAVEALRSSPRW